MLHTPIPIPIIICIIIAFLYDTYGKKSRKSALKNSSDDSIYERPVSERTSEEEANFNAMKKVVAEHQDWTAEVITFFAWGYKRVRLFRTISPGDKVELKMKKGELKIFLYGEYIADLHITSDSNIPRLFNKNIYFEAYLGGRSSFFLSESDFDSCSLIVFYKIDGVPPTKVNLH